MKPHLSEYWVIPPKANAAFVAAMEDVLEVYHRPHDPDRPLVCLDETSKQLVAETRTPLPMQPGHPARHVKVTERRTAVDFAHVLKELSDSHFASAAKIVLLQDNLNTHAPSSLTRPSLRTRRAFSSNASSGITRQNMAAG